MSHCTRCGCPRELHHVNVGGERTGCYSHINCDEWRQVKPLPLSMVCVCGHTLNYHDSLKRLSNCTLTSIKDETGSIPCPCKGFEEKQ